VFPEKVKFMAMTRKKGAIRQELVPMPMQTPAEKVQQLYNTSRFRSLLPPSATGREHGPVKPNRCRQLRVIRQMMHPMIEQA
jgi:hypothetical protein